MANSAPGFDLHPGYHIDIKDLDGELTVHAHGQIIARSKRGVIVEETKHRPVWYVPFDDLDASFLTASNTSTYCPFKGHASYWSITLPDTTIADAIWVYPTPFDECMAIAGYASFYTNKVDLAVDGTAVDSNGPGRQ
jgi:uncharacterized protein (DUF427 family)